MKMIQAVLWDNDGVLVDSETNFFEFSIRAFKELGLVLTKEIWVTQYLGQGISSHDIAISLGGDPVKIEPVLDRRNKQYRISLGSEPPMIRPQVRETLLALSGRVKMGIVTGCFRGQLDLMHGQSGLLDFFDVIVTADNYDELKPNPAPYLTATEALGLESSDCLAVEDSQRGLMSARAASIACLVVPTGLTVTQDFSGAVSVEDDVSAILKYVDKDLVSGDV